MSVSEKIARLERFIRANPALADVPFMVIRGRPVSPREALSLLRSGRFINEVVTGLSRLGIDPEEEMWRLVEEFYRKVAVAAPGIKIYALGGYVPAMSPEEALMHIRRRDEVGKQLLKMYESMLQFMKEALAYA